MHRSHKYFSILVNCLDAQGTTTNVFFGVCERVSHDHALISYIPRGCKMLKPVWQNLSCGSVDGVSIFATFTYYKRILQTQPSQQLLLNTSATNTPKTTNMKLLVRYPLENLDRFDEVRKEKEIGYF